MQKNKNLNSLKEFINTNEIFADIGGTETVSESKKDRS